MNEMEKLMGIFDVDKFKQVHIEVMIENPYVFVLRTKEKNVAVEVTAEEIIIARGDRHNTRITVIPIAEIKDIHIKTYANNEYDIWFNVHGLTYNLFVQIY